MGHVGWEEEQRGIERGRRVTCAVLTCGQAGPVSAHVTHWLSWLGFTDQGGQRLGDMEDGRAGRKGVRGDRGEGGRIG